MLDEETLSAILNLEFEMTEDQVFALSIEAIGGGTLEGYYLGWNPRPDDENHGLNEWEQYE